MLGMNSLCAKQRLHRTATASGEGQTKLIQTKPSSSGTGNVEVINALVKAILWFCIKGRSCSTLCCFSD